MNTPSTLSPDKPATDCGHGFQNPFECPNLKSDGSGSECEYYKCDKCTLQFKTFDDEMK